METSASERSDADLVRATLGADTGARRHRLLRWGAVAAVMLVIGTLATLWLTGDGDAVVYRTEPARRGDLTVHVTATGQVQPLNQVDIGSELSGRIATVEVDYNDHVERGQVLARLDPDELQASVAEQRAALAAARAAVLQAQATRVEARLKYERTRDLAQRELASREEVDVADAALKRAEAAHASAQADVTRASAALETADTRLAKAVIRAPIGGLVLARNVEPGQTVVAALQAPVLFTIAESLERMELHVDVDEADVGRLAEGQSATFSVDAYPDRMFPARVTQVRFAPRTVEGVVTYETLLAVDNSELLLRPGMTATAGITVAAVDDALLVPNAALRYQPPAPATGGTSRGGLLGALMPHRPARERPGDATGPAKPGAGRVWIRGADGPEPVNVEPGLSDGRVTALRSGELAPGTELIVGQEAPPS